VLDVYLFDDLEQVREITEAWLKTYNQIRPHDALGRRPEAALPSAHLKPEIQLLSCLPDGEAYDPATFSGILRL
jgi:transposase InsO family protein